MHSTATLARSVGPQLPVWDAAAAPHPRHRLRLVPLPGEPASAELRRCAPVVDEVEPREVQLCREGNRAALDRVLRAYSADIQATIARLYGWGPDGKDVMQRALLTAVVAFPAFRGDSSVKTWLVGIAINAARDARRRRERRAALERPSGEIPELAVAHLTPERTLTARVCLQRSERLLEGLGTKLRDAYVLHVVFGHSVRDTARLLEIPELTVKSRVARARRRLHLELASEPDLAQAVLTT